jgi:hypothetical protein
MSRIEVDPLPAGDSSARRHFAPVRVWTQALMAGMIAGFTSWLIGEALHRRFDRLAPTLSGPPTSAEMMKSIFIAGRTAQKWEAILGFGSLGGGLGSALGLAGGSARLSVRAAPGAAIVGGILGGAVGVASTQVILPLYQRFLDPDHNDLIVGIMTQVVISAALGAVRGAAFGIGLGDRSRGLRAVLAGLLGAIAGPLVYEMAGALAIPLDKTTNQISATWGSRLFARLAVTTLASAGVAIAAPDRSKRAIPSPVSPEPGA